MWLVWGLWGRFPLWPPAEKFDVNLPTPQNPRPTTEALVCSGMGPESPLVAHKCARLTDVLQLFGC